MLHHLGSNFLRKGYDEGEGNRYNASTDGSPTASPTHKFFDTVQLTAKGVV